MERYAHRPAMIFTKLTSSALELRVLDYRTKRCARTDIRAEREAK